MLDSEVRDELLAKLQFMHDNLDSQIDSSNKTTVKFVEMLDGCKSCSSLLINLVNDLLDLAKQEKQTFSLNKGYFNLIETI